MQPDLFGELLSSASRPRRVQMPLFPSRFIRLRVAYEDMIFVWLGLVLLMLGGFCVGVERGKHLMGQKNGGAFSSPPPVTVAREELSLPVVKKSAPAVEGAFAIQLASYVGSQAAQMEAHRLREHGLKAEVVDQGKFFELRVAGFTSRTEALAQLASLRKTYHDAFIKSVSSRKLFAKKQA